MQFINPFNLLDLEASEVPSSEKIREAKRRVELEFDLSEGNSAEINGHSVLRSDFLRVTDELDDEQKREFYFELHERLPKLNRFLVEGNLDFFRDYQHESLYTHDPFVEFVSPHFAHQYNRHLRSAIKDEDHSRIELLTSHDPLVTEEQKPELYEGAKQHIRHLREDAESIKRRIRQGEELPPREIRAETMEIVDVDLLNALPDDLEGERSQLASIVRSLSVAVFNELDNAELARDLLLNVRDLKVSSVTENRLEKNFEEIEEICEQRRLADRYSDELEECGRTITRLSELVEEADQETAQPNRLRKEAEDIVDIDTLNELPDDFEQIRNQVALGLRNLSTMLWNSHQSGETAVSLTKLALCLQTEASLKADLREDLELLKNLTEEAKQVEREQIQQLSSLVSELRSQVESASGIFSGKSVNWSAVRQFIRSTFTEECIRFLEDADESPKRQQLFKDLSFVLSAMPSDYIWVDDALLELVNSIESKSSKQSSSSSSKRTTLQSSASTSSHTRKNDEGSTIGCFIAATIGIIILLIALAS